MIRPFQIRDLGQENGIVILNGYQIEEDYPLAENDIITIIPKGVMPKQDELESMMMARHTPHVHERLKKGKVAIAGLGAWVQILPLCWPGAVLGSCSWWILIL